MKMPKVSVITASYNSGYTIEDTIKSVFNQSYKNLEFIVIDGGSTDNTLSLLRKYENSFGGKLKWISENDKGIYDAWNKGLNLSSGDWISFIGSDDIILENSISKYIDAINNNPDINYISSQVLQVTYNLKPVRVTGKAWCDEMRSFCCISHVGSLHKKVLFNEKGLFNSDFRIAGDYDFLLRCTDIIKPYFIPVITAKTREGGISDRKIFRVAKEVLKAKNDNKIKSTYSSLIDFCIMILKYYPRILINKLHTQKLNSITDFSKY
jgi:glycosyltransferase involved in cell wall biosynthesis